jgi:hypothetical protein
VSRLRYRTNVWAYRGANTLRRGRMEELALHPTVKPVQLIADAIKDVSGRGDIVLHLFGGSGSTLIAAHKTGRRAYLCELDLLRPHDPALEPDEQPIESSHLATARRMSPRFKFRCSFRARATTWQISITRVRCASAWASAQPW